MLTIPLFDNHDNYAELIVVKNHLIVVFKRKNNSEQDKKLSALRSRSFARLVALVNLDGIVSANTDMQDIQGYLSDYPQDISVAHITFQQEINLNLMLQMLEVPQLWLNYISAKCYDSLSVIIKSYFDQPRFLSASLHQNFLESQINSSEWKPINSEFAEYKSANSREEDLLTMRVVEVSPGFFQTIDPRVDESAILKNDNGSMPALCSAARKGYGTAVANLLSIDDSRINQPGSNRLTPVMLAAKNGCVGALSVLIAKGANTELSLPNGMNALMIAVTNEREGCVEKLLTPENINHARVDGWTPLMLAAENGCLSILEKLLELGANRDQTRPDGMNALMIAVSNNQFGAVEKLLTPENVNYARLDGWTPLMFAAEAGNVHIVNLLLSRGAHATQSLPNGTTVGKIACDNGNENIAAILERHIVGIFRPMTVFPARDSLFGDRQQRDPKIVSRPPEDSVVAHRRNSKGA